MTSAVILAGGKSSRFGSDKAFAKFGDSTLVESVFVCLKNIFDKIIIVTNNPILYLGFDALVVKDIIQGKGPLGGIYTGLKTTSSHRIFTVACDMPFLKEDFISYMASIENGDVVVPKIENYIEPLHAVYSKACLPHIERQLKEGNNKIQNFFDKVHTVYIKGDILKNFDPELKMFFNVNEKRDIGRTVIV